VEEAAGEDGHADAEDLPGAEVTVGCLSLEEEIVE
jgi:hypothetical protein